MITLSNLHPAKGANRKRKRVGRGPGSGFGKTAGRGMNGQKSRSGFSRRRGFEGGQMPLIRRVPKRGFTNPFRKVYHIVNLAQISRLNLDELSIKDYYRLNLVKGKKDGIKVLGGGELKKKMKIHAHKFSQSALEKIKKAGGEAIIEQGEKN